MYAKFEGHGLSAAWLSVYQATGDDQSRPALYRTVHIERYRNGCRLISCDGHLLLNAWVPALEQSFSDEPDIDELPDAEYLVFDEHQRVAAFMKHIFKITTPKGEKTPEEVEILLRAVPYIDENTQPSFEGMDPPGSMIIERPGKEKLTLALVESPFVAWRQTIHAYRPRTTSTLRLDASLIGRIATLETWNPGCPIDWSFGGPSDVALFEIAGSWPRVAGGVMPIVDRAEEPVSGATVHSVTVTLDDAEALRGVADRLRAAGAEEPDNEDALAGAGSVVRPLVRLIPPRSAKRSGPGRRSAK